jgi:hypothetical protein
MSVLRDDEALEQPPVDPLLGRLDQILVELAAIVADDSPTADSVRIDRIACLEKIRAVTAAAQAAESVKFAQSQVSQQIATDVHPAAIGRGIANKSVSPATYRQLSRPAGSTAPGPGGSSCRTLTTTLFPGS